MRPGSRALTAPGTAAADLSRLCRDRSAKALSPKLEIALGRLRGYG